MMGFWRRWLSKKWTLAIAPVLTLIFFFLFFNHFFQHNEAFFNRSQQWVIQGQVPKVSYTPTRHFIFAVGYFIFASLSLLVSLLQWAKYFVYRKLGLAFLLAMIPFLATILIFGYGIRAYFGLVNTLNIERVTEMASNALENMAINIQQELQFSHANYEEKIARIIQQSRRSDSQGQEFLQSEELSVDVFFRTRKRPGESRYLITAFSLKRSILYDGYFVEESEEYEKLLPHWLPKMTFSDVVNIDQRLHIRTFSLVSFDDGDQIVIADLPIEKGFLNRLKAFQPVRISLSDKDDSQFIATDSPEDGWYWRYLLLPLSSTWDIQALNWSSGYYEHFGPINFQIEPAEILQTMGQQGNINLFHSGEKQLVMRLIIAFTLILALTEFWAMSFGIFLIYRMTGSLNSIADGHENVATGRLTYRVPYLGKDQLGEMGRSFNSMANNIESLLQQVMDQQKYKEELRIARDIQMSLLPDVDQLDWCDNVAATCIPAYDVGGDYYELLHVGPGRTGIFIADVSGKGTSAAFYMAELKGVLLALREEWADPEALMLAMNHILFPALKANVFISAAYCLLDAESGYASLARAGHCPAFHVHEAGISDLSPPGMALGIAKNEVFGRILRVTSFEMQPNDKIVLYTDGLDEMTFHNEMYGIKRLRRNIGEHSEKGVHELKEKILQDVLTFLSSGQQNDDLTLVVAGLSRSWETPS